MNIKKITLKNFRNYKDVEIDFSSDDPSKKITVVLGNITYGKTTLVKAFLWCLYGDNTFPDKGILNLDVRDSMRPGDRRKAEVSVVLVHKNKRYNIIASEEFEMRQTQNGNYNIASLGRDVRMTVVEGGNTKSYGSEFAASEINSILRSELKDYFFFDGESNKIDTVTTKHNLNDAINNLLDIKKLIDIVDYYSPKHSDSVITTLNGKLHQDIDTSLQQYNEKLRSEQDSYENAKTEIENNSNEINELKEQINECNQKLNEGSSIREAQQTKKDEVENKKRLESNIERNFKSTLGFFSGEYNSNNNRFLNALFSYSFNHSNIKNILDLTTFSSRSSYTNITEKAVDDLISKGECICGTKIVSGSDAYNHLIEAKQHMEPHDYSSYVMQFKSDEDYNSSHSRIYVSQAKDLIKQILDDASGIDECDNIIEEANKKIRGDIDYGTIESLVEELSRNVGRLEALNEVKEKECIDHDITIKQYLQKIQDSAGKSEINRRIQKGIDYANKILEAATHQIERANILIREDLQEQVQTIFKSIYSGDRQIFITDEYKVRTRLENGSFIDGTGGLDTITNFSFVIGLMNLAKLAAATHRYTEGFDDTQTIEDVHEIYPLVLDAPFSNADAPHIQTICQALLDNCDQVIIFVKENDFEYAKNILANGICHKYRLVKLAETESQIEEVM